MSSAPVDLNSLAGTPNPLLAPLRRFLAQPGVHASEYQLITWLRAEGYLPDLPGGSPLALFRVHFALFNALYQWQDSLLGSGTWLHISPLDIWLEPTTTEPGTMPGEWRSDPLRAFYLDWQHWERATEQTVAELLGDFWRRYACADVSIAERDQALAVLELRAPVAFDRVKYRYRQLAMRHHPDRGGCARKLQALNGAMAVLERHYRSAAGPGLSD